MIEYIDEMMWRWAKELHSRDGHTGGSVLARLIESQGVLITSTANSKGSVSVDIELIVNKKLPLDLQRLAYVRYIEEIHPPWLELNMPRRTYFRRLNLLHASVKEFLYARRAISLACPTRFT